MRMRVCKGGAGSYLIQQSVIGAQPPGQLRKVKKACSPVISIINDFSTHYVHKINKAVACAGYLDYHTGV